jgi:hypothetical protein
MAELTYPATYGPLIHQVSVDKALLHFLHIWFPTWLTGTEQREGRPTRWLPRPHTYITTYEEDDEDFYSDHRLPAVVVTAGEASDWRHTGEGLWMATYRTVITVVSRGRSMPEQRLQSALYVATITDMVLGRPSLDGFANGVRPVSERVRPIEDPSNRSRVLGAGQGVYDVLVTDVRRSYQGPAFPEPPEDPDTPLDPYPPVEEVDVGITGIVGGTDVSIGFPPIAGLHQQRPSGS